MKRWFASQELAELGLPALAGSERRIRSQAEREGWRSRPREGRGGGREYHLASLPDAARIELARRALSDDPISSPNCVAGGLPSGVVAAQSASSRPSGFTAAFSHQTADRTPTRRTDDVEKAAFFGNSRATQRGAARGALVRLVIDFAAASGFSMAVARAQIVTLYNRGELEVAPWIRAEIKCATVRSLERWHSQIDHQGLSRVNGNYGHRKGSGQIDGDETLRDFCVLQMAANSKLTAKQLAQFIETRFDTEIPKRSVQRFMATARIEHADAFLAAQDPDAFKNKRMVAFGSRSEAVQALNQLWETDASPADILVLDPNAPSGRRRMALIAVIDVYSRRAKVRVCETSTARNVLAVLRDFILDVGFPQTVKMDNGQDFAAVHVAYAFQALKIEQRFCTPFKPEEKPHVERFFGTLTRDHLALLPGFVGHNVADRKAIEARRAFSNRLGEADKLIDVSMTAEDLQASINAWLEADYHARSHEGIGMSPRLKAANWIGERRGVSDERALDMLLAQPADGNGMRVVGKKGLRVEGTYFISPELALHIGAHVSVRLLDDDMGRIVVYSASGEFICVAEAPERTGADRREIAIAAKRVQREDQAEARRELNRKKRELQPHKIVDEVLADQDRRASRIVAFERPSVPYETPGLSAASEAAMRLSGRGNEAPPLTAEELEGAAEFETMAEVVQLQTRSAPDDLDDFDWVLKWMNRREELNSIQIDMLDEFLKSPSIRARLAQLREAKQA